MFEAIDKNGSIPGNGTEKRKFDLVAKIDSTEGYEGTAAIIHSPFWRLLENESLKLTEVREMVVECVQLLDLAKLGWRFSSRSYPSWQYEDCIISN